MGYYTRAFCTGDQVPLMRDILVWINAKGYNIKLDDPDGKIDTGSAEWQQVGVLYKEGKLPILVECARDDGSNECLLRQEVEEFLEEIGAPRLSLAKRRVIKHLKSTKFVISMQLPTADIDDDGYDANGELLRYFMENYGGLIQADGEGFYEGTKLIVQL